MRRLPPGLLPAVAALCIPMVLTAGGCSALDALNLAKPTAQITALRLKDISLSDATLEFDMEVSNPYSVPLPLVNVDYALTSGAGRFLAGAADLQGSVPARGSKTVSLPAKITYLEVLKALKQVRPGSVVPYTAEMGLSVKPPVAEPLRLPLKKEGRLPVPTVPEVEVQEVRWEKLTAGEAAGLVRLNLVNRNEFPVDLSALKYALSLGGVEVARSSLRKPVALAADRGAGTVEIPISLSPKDLGFGVLRMLTGSESGYNLSGDMDVQTPFGPMALPISKAGKTPLTR